MTPEVMETRPARRYHAFMTSFPANSTAAHSPTNRQSAPAFGDHLRHWRQHRRLSQLDLAEEAEVSARHLSFVETGRSVPSREMVLRLAERLAVPLRERNTLLVAAGYAPMYRERPLSDPALASARQAIETILKSHEPYPALAVDRHWHLVASNRMLAPLLAGVDESLLAAPVNVLRLSLHPLGLAPRIVNLGQWRTHLFERLRQQIHATGDGALAAMLEELRSFPLLAAQADAHIEGELPGVLLPLQFRSDAGVLNFISTTTIFGSPVDVTLQEIALETFFPADEATGAALRRIAINLIQ
jgi:transcriptional regulator with XRE-family HTH domain